MPPLSHRVGPTQPPATEGCADPRHSYTEIMSTSPAAPEPRVSAVPSVNPDARIDLHTHSSESDGTETPTALVGAAEAAGLN